MVLVTEPSVSSEEKNEQMCIWTSEGPTGELRPANLRFRGLHKGKAGWMGVGINSTVSLVHLLSSGVSGMQQPPIFETEQRDTMKSLTSQAIIQWHADYN